MKRLFSVLAVVLLALSLSTLTACSSAPPKDEPVGVPPKPEENFAPRRSTQDDLTNPKKKPEAAPTSETATPEAEDAQTEAPETEAPE